MMDEGRGVRVEGERLSLKEEGSGGEPARGGAGKPDVRQSGIRLQFPSSISKGRLQATAS